ncbi:calcineurin-like phosphoesterase family protein [Bradymonas sediminis]|nr:calcineurin-like phosphoesterase family protein [Bradymonas sediminis]
MRNYAPRVSSFVVLPVLLLVACTQVGGRSGAEGALVLETRASDSAQARATQRGARASAERQPHEDTKPASPRPQTPPDDASPADEALVFAVVSDLNGRYGAQDYADGVHESVRWLVEDVRPDLVVSTGDMVAGQRAGLDYEAMWAGFHAAVTTPFARAGIPFAVTPGNHDASAGAVFYQERITFVEQWRARRPQVEFVDDRFYPLHYAFKTKGVLFVSLDATTVGPIDATQRRWLREVLQANRDARAKVVFGHIPLYPVSQGRETEILRDAKLEAMLNEFDVDLMLAGHHHAYYPGRRGDLRLVSMACLGSGPRKLIGSDVVSPKSVVVARVAPDGEVSLDAYASTSERHGAHPKIERSTLPESLNEGAQRVWRDDVTEGL